MMTRVLIVDDQRTAREVMEIAVNQSKKYSVEEPLWMPEMPIFIV